MRSGITRRWLRGNLLITVLLVLLAETMFLYNYTRSYSNSVQQSMYRRFSSDTNRAIPSPALLPAATGSHPSGRSSEKLPVVPQIKSIFPL